MDRRQPSVRVGRYAVYGTIATGGMASVHWGRLVGEAGFARVVAIKRLHPQFAADPDFTSMLLDEARIVARIRHPNVVPTLDVAFGDGELLLVMEYVHGEALSKLMRTLDLRGQEIPPPIAVAILCGVLDGLEAAHEANDEQGAPLSIVHRDVTPQNILVGADGVPRIVDFGVAHAGGRLYTTRDGVLKGKIRYMSPEQVRSQEVDRRTDLYAAGIVLWEMLSGQRAFDADNDVAVLAKVLEEELPSVAARNPRVSKPLDAVLAKSISRDKKARFETAHAMALALEAACPPATSRELAAWVTSLAAETLTERAEMLAAVESEDTGSIDRARGAVQSLRAPPISMTPGTLVPPGARSTLSSPAAQPPPRPGADDETRNLGPDPIQSANEPTSQLTSLTKSTAPPAHRARTRWIAALMVTIVLGLVVAILLLLRGPSSTTSRATASAPTSASPSVSAPSPRTDVAPSAAPSASELVPATDPHHPASHPTSSGPAQTKPDCKDPFRTGSDGILHVRRECLP